MTEDQAWVWFVWDRTEPVEGWTDDPHFGPFKTEAEARALAARNPSYRAGRIAGRAR